MFRLQNLNALFFASLAFCSLSHAAIKPTSSTEPYYFVADRVTYLSKAHTITYMGHVKVDQGATHITGDKLVLHLTTTNKIIKMTDEGNPATYTTVLKNRPGTVHAKAGKITYNQIQDKVYLDEHASVEQNHNLIRAAHITYDKKNGVIHTRGTPQQTSTHIVVMPQQQPHKKSKR